MAALDPARIERARKALERSGFTVSKVEENKRAGTATFTVGEPKQ